jgi:hypothetical protein
MKVSGFTFVKNAIKYDFPIVEAITSILPVCDEMIVSVGRSEDDTLGLIRSILSPKIKIFETEWDDSQRQGGRVLAIETDKAFSKVASDSDWAFYIQGDEVVHEKYLPAIKASMYKWKDDERVEGLLFDYKHFYGSYDYVGDSHKWYRKEVRIIRNDKKIHSYRDAQGFRKNGQPLKVMQVDATVYHYGWVKPPVQQQAKREAFEKLWHDDKEAEKRAPKKQEFDYSGVDSLTVFADTHPQVMRTRIENKSWKFIFDTSRKNFSLKGRILFFIEKLTGWRIGEYKNYKLIS